MRRVDPHGEALAWCLGYAQCRLEPKLMNRCRIERHRNSRENVEMYSSSSKKGWCQTEAGKDGKSKGQKVTGKGCEKQREEFEVGDFHCTKRLVEHCQKEDARGQRNATQRRVRLNQRIQGHVRRKSSQQLIEG